MGSPLSPVVANIFIKDFEQTAPRTMNYQPKLWLRYVDDTWQLGDDHLQEFLQHLNGLHNRILFTMEKEDNHKLHFLGVLVEKTSNRLKTNVYRKPSYTDQYLHYQSNNHPRVKSAVLHRLPNLSTIRIELLHLSSKLNLRMFQVGYSTASSLTKISNAVAARTFHMSWHTARL